MAGTYQYFISIRSSNVLQQLLWSQTHTPAHHPYAMCLCHNSIIKCLCSSSCHRVPYCAVFHGCLLTAAWWCSSALWHSLLCLAVSLRSLFVACHIALCCCCFCFSFGYCLHYKCCLPLVLALLSAKRGK